MHTCSVGTEPELARPASIYPLSSDVAFRTEDVCRTVHRPEPGPWRSDGTYRSTPSPIPVPPHGLGDRLDDWPLRCCSREPTQLLCVPRDDLDTCQHLSNAFEGATKPPRRDVRSVDTSTRRGTGRARRMATRSCIGTSARSVTPAVNTPSTSLPRDSVRVVRFRESRAAGSHVRRSRPYGARFAERNRCTRRPRPTSFVADRTPPSRLTRLRAGRLRRR